MLQQLQLQPQQKQAGLPDNMKSVQKMQDLVCLLPNGMADGSGQCLKMLETLLQQASASTVTYASNIQGDGVSDCSAMEHIQIPLFPGGD